MAGQSPEVLLCCRACLRRSAPQTRSFTTSSSQQKHGPLPFIPTSSPTLDTILQTWRSNVFLPSHLLRPQQLLVYKKNNHALLTGEEPVTVDVGPEIHTLVPLDHRTSEPNTKKSFHEILALLHTPADWKNMVPFLEELRTARRKVTPAMVQKLVRKANERGRQGAVMEILQSVGRTGVVLRGAELVREVMGGAVMRAQAAGWGDGEGVGRALRYAEGVVDLCEDPRHTEGRMIWGDDPRARPEVVGTVMLLAGVKVKRFQGGKDEDGKVRRYAERMMALWRYAGLDLEGKDWNAANQILFTWSPVWHGMRIALEYLEEGSDLAKEVKGAMTRDLEPVLERAKDLVVVNAPDGRRPRGLEMYESLAAELGS
ncbi:MAG: hypothetical protein FRX48_03293 [Lasallia pustulata]|uniref:Uncharacterized protein n=1 Tax=Lasallia pustulata TaxID=136370 RepID=A0A5M8PX95_9LECA|nr:MAG: hypothetical protein FRX48_03293 [Lasallia pustulata]